MCQHSGVFERHSPFKQLFRLLPVCFRYIRPACAPPPKKIIFFRKTIAFCRWIWYNICVQSMRPVPPAYSLWMYLYLNTSAALLSMPILLSLCQASIRTMFFHSICPVCLSSPSSLCTWPDRPPKIKKPQGWIGATHENLNRR